jgi:putative nucleotidyltransferase with HDIG domain
VQKKTTELSLLAKASGVEVMLQTISSGALFGLSPAQDGAAEFVYILSGECFLQDNSGSESAHLGPGDCVAASGLIENAYFKSVTDLQILYVSSQPVFSYVSDQIAELVEMARSVEKKDYHTAQHCERLQKYATMIGERLGLAPHRMEHLIYAALLHDVGKAGVPSAILGKSGPLRDDEVAEVRKHPALGAEMVARTYLKDVARIIEQHHERYDGSGYPAGLDGSQITMEAAIISCVDAYDAMTSDRPYRKTLSQAEAALELRRHRGRQFHPLVVDILLDILREEEKVPSPRHSNRNRPRRERLVRV